MLSTNCSQERQVLQITIHVSCWKLAVIFVENIYTIPVYKDWWFYLPQYINKAAVKPLHGCGYGMISTINIALSVKIHIEKHETNNQSIYTNILSFISVMAPNRSNRDTSLPAVVVNILKFAPFFSNVVGEFIFKKCFRYNLVMLLYDRIKLYTIWS